MKELLDWKLEFRSDILGKAFDAERVASDSVAFRSSSKGNLMEEKTVSGFFKSLSFEKKRKNVEHVLIPFVEPENEIVKLPSSIIIPVASSELNHSYELERAVTSRKPIHTADHNKPERLHSLLFSNSSHDGINKDGSHVVLSHSYPNVCVIFSDISGFTSLSSTISPKELVTMLNAIFSKFDNIMDEYHLEKIRTVGDAYLCVANMSIPLEKPEEVCVRVALEMITAIKNIKNSLSLRVGIASGPLIAGVTGTTKWNYDIFGKPFTEANVMETLAPHNCVAVSESIFNACSQAEAFTRHVSEDGGDYYVVSIDSFQNILLDPLSTARSNSAFSDNLALLAQPLLSTFDEEVLEYTDVFPDLQEDIDDSDIQIDLQFKLGFSRDEIDKQVKMLKKQRLYFQFSQEKLENEFYKVFGASVRVYVKYYCILLGIFQIIQILVDIAIVGGGPLDIVVKVLYPLSSFILFLYSFYSGMLESNISLASAVSFIVAFQYGSSFVLSYIFMKSSLHITWAMISILVLAGFVRVPALYMIIGQFLYTLTLTFFIAFKEDDYEYSNRYLIIMFGFIVVSGYSLLSMQKSFRGKFLAHKILKYDMCQQKISQHRSQLLLHNILPSEIIPRLHRASTEEGSGIVDLFEQATIMFVNLINLEDITNASSMFQVYNDLFTLFDEATYAYGLEKIKTINTVYMIACGLPNQITNHVDVAIQLAAEIYSITKKYTFPLITEKVEVRIGIASGPVVAGIIGKKKYSYDCWSDTTNTPSRMESNGWPGHLQASPDSFLLSSYKHHFFKREKLNIKGKGIMDAYVFQLSKFVS